MHLQPALDSPALRPATGRVALTATLLATAAGFAIPGTGLARAQAQPFDRAIVVSQPNVAGSTVVWEVDLQTGAFTALPPFSTDAFSPLAVVADPVDKSLIVALDRGTQSQIMRRRYGANPTEALLATVPGRVEDLLIDRFGDVTLVIGGSAGGVFRLDRLTGALATVRSMPFATAAATLQDLAWYAVIGTSGAANPPRDPQLGNLDLGDGAWLQGPTTLTGFTPRGIVGMVDMPTAVPRQILAHETGDMSIYSWGTASNPLLATVTPTLPPGGIAAMKAHGGPAFVLGGAVNPNLYTFDPTTAIGGGVALTMVAGPLPAIPVDFTIMPLAAASLVTFGRPCGGAAELRIGQTPNGPPQLGNATFGVALRQAEPNGLAWLALGFGETTFPFPNGCELRVTLDAVVAAQTDSTGDASATIPIPNLASLLGVRFFGEWLQPDNLLPFMTSDLARIEIGL